MKYTWQHAASQSTNRLWCSKHLYIAEPTYETRTTIRTSIHLHPGPVMMSVKESRKASLVVQYFEHLKLVDESEALVFPMKAYDLVLGLPWFKARNPEIDWTKGR